MAITTLHGPHEIHQSLGKHLGYSEWMEITQDRVNLFASATGDHQWIHVDPERAINGPFGALSPTDTSPCQFLICFYRK